MHRSELCPRHVLGIDVGTGGTRALIIDADGRIVASATEEHEPFASPKIGWAEQHPEDWWRAAASPSARPWRKPNLRGDQIACVGFSGQMHGAVMLDANGEVVRPALIWCDVRTEKQCKELNRTHWRRKSDSAHLQSRAPEFHADEISVGARKRAGKLEARSLRDAAERLCALPADGRTRHRRGRRFRHADARCGQVASGRTKCLKRRRSMQRSCRAVRIAGCLRKNLRRRRGGHRSRGGHAGRRGRRRSSRRRHGHGHRHARRGQRHDRHFGSCFCGDGSPGARSKRPPAHFLPRHSRPLARDGRHASGGPFAALVPRSISDHRRRKSAAIPTNSSPPKPRRFQPAPTACSGLRI